MIEHKRRPLVIDHPESKVSKSVERIVRRLLAAESGDRGPLTAPNHKLVPDSRWILDYPHNRVVARADPDGPHPKRGVALYVTSRFAIFRHAYTNPVDPTSVQVPPDGWRRIATSSARRSVAPSRSRRRTKTVIP